MKQIILVCLKYAVDYHMCLAVGYHAKLSWNSGLSNLFETRRITRAFARLVLKIQKIACCLSLFKDYTIFLPYITLFIIVNYILLLVKTIQI